MQDLTAATSVESLMSTIVSGPPELLERALQLLAWKCIDVRERKAMYSDDGTRALLEVARVGKTYFSQLYALESLSWGDQDHAGLSKAEYAALREVVRVPNHEELAALVEGLKHGTDQEKDDAVLVCGCIGSLAPSESFVLDNDDLVPCLVGFLKPKTSTDTQKEWAVYALGKLACSEACRKAVVDNGSIHPIVQLVRTGTDRQKQWAAATLGNIASDEGTQWEIAREGGISALVALVTSGSDEQQWMGSFALASLALCEENRPKIARKGGIPPLVKLLGSDGYQVKRRAANALGNIAYSFAQNSEAITEEGAVPALVAMVQSGTDEEKEMAAYALGNLACSSSVVKDALRSTEAASALRGLKKSESKGVREAGKTALDQVNQHDKVRGLLGNLKLF